MKFIHQFTGFRRAYFNRAYFNRAPWKRTWLFGILGGGILAGLSSVASQAVAQTNSVNPCPSIYYEEPYNSNVMTPEGCPPNALTQLLQGGYPTPTRPGYPLGPNQGGADPSYDPTDDAPIDSRPAPITDQPGGQTPYPYEPYGQEGVATDRPPIAQVEPVDGTVDVQLRNATNIDIYYEVTGETSRRIIPADQAVYLRNISLPATITTVRTDEGLLRIVPERTTEGVLELSLEEDPTFDDTQGVIRIQPDGEVFVN